MSIEAPNPVIVEEIIQILLDHKVRADPRSIAIDVAVFTHWLKNTPAGTKFMIELLQLEVIHPIVDNQYYGEATNGRLTKSIKPDSIKFLRGCLVDGGPYPLKKLDIQEREFQYCDCCGCEVICTTQVLSPYSNKLEDVCSKCVQSNNFRANITFNCESCMHHDCNWHPLNIDRPIG